ncbi:hypothetical protein QBC35DRAFT_554231 [Podospora australis]|uniref:Uncharacterized protein n=1 Tax=Podospora australis TaxID=1536484 RepID=A0AAN7AHM7_9PEZI|nr:hypothetical protein QBC35DRAFT_554231 [Podospora australis]
MITPPQSPKIPCGQAAGSRGFQSISNHRGSRNSNTDGNERTDAGQEENATSSGSIPPASSSVQDLGVSTSISPNDQVYAFVDLDDINAFNNDADGNDAHESDAHENDANEDDANEDDANEDNTNEDDGNNNNNFNNPMADMQADRRRNNLMREAITVHLYMLFFFVSMHWAFVRFMDRH